MELTLEEFQDKVALRGEWTIHYHDPSHLPPFDRTDQVAFVSDRLDNTVRLGSVATDPAPPSAEASVIPFSFKLDSQEQLKDGFRKCWSEDLFKKIKAEGGNGREKGFISSLATYPMTIYGEISDTLTRTRIYRPEIDSDDWNAFADKRNLIFISETSSIRRGIISYLADVFEDKHIWVIIPVVSMLELQDASGRAKFALSDKTDFKKCGLIHTRPMSTSSTHELLTLRRRHIPIEFLEVPPDLLRYYSGEHQVLRDRLILEGVKRIIKEKSTAERIYLLSGDQDMVKFARLENIEAVYAGKAQLRGGENVYSARYDIYKKGFIGCGVHEFIWDLTRVFSFIKVENPQTGKVVTLDYYFRKKSVRDWEEDRIDVAEVTLKDSEETSCTQEEARNESDGHESLGQANPVELTA
jgi:hypothetical protein